MSDLIEFVTVPVVVLLVITLVGHGIWELLAFSSRLFRRLFQPSDRRTQANCPACGKLRGIRDNLCHACGYRLPIEEIREINLAISHLDRLRGSGRLAEEAHALATRALVAHRYELEFGRSSPLRSRPTGDGQNGSGEPSSGGPAVVAPIPTQSAAPADATASAADPTVDDYVVAELVGPPQGGPAHTGSSTSSLPPESSTAEPDPLFDDPAPTEASPVSVPATARRTMADMLQSFMEDKNIRWGELASGMLIVGSAIGLVISLRATLAQLSEHVPYFPALLFMLGTAAIHGAGLYTLRRWNLRSTSRGVLTIAILLVPLSFAAGIVMAGTGANRVPITSFWYAAAVLVGIASYSTITAFSARALFVEGWWRIVLAVIGPSIGQIVINRMAFRESGQAATLTVTALALIPLLSYLVALVGQLLKVRHRAQLSRIRSTQTITLLGTGLFSLAVPFGLLVWLRGNLGTTLAQLSPVLNAAVAGVLGIGLTLHTRCRSSALVEYRTTGTALSVLGGLLMLGTVLLAWPSPEHLVAVGALSVIALVGFSFIGRMPELGIGAMLAGTFSLLVGFHWASGRLETGLTSSRVLVEALVMGRSAWLLVLPIIGCGVFARWFHGDGQPEVARLYRILGIGLSGMSASIAAYAGFWSGVDGNSMTLLFACNTTALFVLTAMAPRPAVTWFATGLLLTTIVHAITCNEWMAERASSWPWRWWHVSSAALLVHAAACQGLACLAAAWDHRRSPAGAGAGRAASGLIEPLALSGAMTAVLALPLALILADGTWAVTSQYLAVISLTLASCGWHVRSRQVSTMGHLAAAAAIGCAGAAWASNRDWGARPLIDLRHVQLQVCIYALWSCGLNLLRRIAIDRKRPALLLSPTRLNVDQLLTVAGAIAVLVMGLIAALPGTAQELGVITAGHAWAVDTWHAMAGSPGTWMAAFAVFVALLSSRQANRRVWVAVSVACLSMSLPLLLAGQLEPVGAVASGLRWILATYALIGSGLLILVRERPWKQLGWSSELQRTADQWTRHLGSSPVALAVLLVTLLTAVALVQGISVHRLNLPDPGSWPGQLESRWLYGVPLALVSLAAAIQSVVRRQPILSFLASMLTVYMGLVILWLPMALQREAWELGSTVASLQWTTGSIAACSLIWLSLGRWWRKADLRDDFWLQMQMAMSGAGLAILTAVLFLKIAHDPFDYSWLAGHWGNGISYIVWFVCLLAFWFYGSSSSERVLGWRRTVIIYFGLALSTLIAASCHRWNTPTNWLGYHLLSVPGLRCCEIAAPAVGWATWRQPSRRLARQWAITATWVCAAVFGMLIDSHSLDPYRPWWTIGLCTAMFLVMVVLGTAHPGQLFPLLSLIVVGFATAVTWLSGGVQLNLWWNGVFLHVFTITLGAFVWLIIDCIDGIRVDDPLEATGRRPRVHSMAIVFGLATCLLVIVGGEVGGVLLENLTGRTGRPLSLEWPVWSAVTALGLALVVTLWDRRSTYSIIGLYFWGIAATALCLNFAHRTLGWTSDVTLVAISSSTAFYVAITGHLWRRGAVLAQQAERWKVPHSIDRLETTARWLPGFTGLATVVIIVFGLVTNFANDQRLLRMLAALAPLAASYGVACMAQQKRRFVFQCAALLAAGASAVLVGWADIGHSPSGPLALTLVARLVIVLAGLTLLYGLALPRWLTSTHPWYRAARLCSSIAGVAAVSCLMAALVLEVMTFQPGVGAPVATAELVAMAIMLCGLVVTLLAMAILPGTDPFGLSETGRQAYVYAAQLVATLLFGHLYLTCPEIFDGTLRPYWPYLIMGLAFVSVGIGEFFHRRGWEVVSIPIQRTGGFMPLLPAIGIWFVSSQTDYPLVLFFGGLIYVFMSITRRSFLAGAGAALFGNGAIWSLLADARIDILNAPQFWLIPPAVSVLAAAHINRDRLTDSTLTAIRYICIVIIYVSSAGEVFMRMLIPHGGEDWLRPVILAALSVMGIFAGIIFRVRAFLYLGASFLFLSLVAMVWHAARLVQHTWPWWAFGITLGLMILTMFGIFEKNRREIERLIVRLRHWEP